MGCNHPAAQPLRRWRVCNGKTGHAPNTRAFLVTLHRKKGRMLQCSNSGEAKWKSQERLRSSRAPPAASGGRWRRIGAPQHTRAGARRHGREHREGRRRESMRMPAGKSRIRLSRRHDRRGVPRVGIRFDQQRVRHGHDVRAGRRHHARRSRRAHRQDDGQGAHLSGRAVQAGPRRQPRRHPSTGRSR